MKKLIIFTLLLLVNLTSAQTNYEKGMQKAFELMKENKLAEAEQLFERIAKAEEDKWLPNYYIAQINSNKSWTVKDVNILQAQLDKAQEYLNLAKAISKDNPEILVLQALIYTNWVAFDGMTYGMKYGAKIAEIYNSAYLIAPENPRVVYCRADWGIGSAKYFGQDTAPFCKDFEKAQELFANFKPESIFHPNWGKGRLVELVNSCKE